MADTIVIPDEGKVRALAWLSSLGRSFAAPTVRLLRAVPIPADHTLVLADLLPATYAGYADTLTANWTDPPIVGVDFRAVIQADAQVYLPGFGVTQTIFGFALYSTQAPNVALAVRLFGVPFVIGSTAPLLIEPRLYIGPIG